MGKMLSRRQMQHLCICLALGLLLCSLWQAAAWGRTQLHTGDAVCADTLRLHIRAASDAVADQSAKLRVRDAVLACLDAACPAGNQTDARSWAARNLFTLQLAARHALARCGVNAPVQVQLVNMYFPARQYTGGCLPAGRYDAVRITIGSGSGQNWWCVLYPGLCRSCLFHIFSPSDSFKTAFTPLRKQLSYLYMSHSSPAWRPPQRGRAWPAPARRRPAS